MVLSGHSLLGDFRMGDRKIIHGRGISEQALSKAQLASGSARGPFQLVYIHDSQTESGITAVIEQDKVDELTGPGAAFESSDAESEDVFDLQDLLLDEAD
jgi:hypothetical protein